MSDLLRADRAVKELSDGQFSLEADGDATVYFVKALTGERVQVPRANGHLDGHADRLALLPTLSKREQQIFTLLGEGHGMAEIATRMNVSVKTAETYRARLKQKLDIKSRSLLIALAVEHRLLHPTMNGEARGDGHPTPNETRYR